MAKLLPPYIEGGINAQIGDGIAIPFRLNRAVSIYQVKKMYARIKTVATDRWLGTLETVAFGASETDGTYIASFELGDIVLNPGQSYKVQLAFGDGSVQGYFSSVGVFKYTTKPDVYIENLVSFETGNLYTYTGVYDQSKGDITEKVYNYRFDVYRDGALMLSSGLLLHDSYNDVDPRRSSDTWVLNQQLQHGVTYQIKYTIWTINGLTESCQYNIVNNEIDDPTLIESYSVEPENDYDNGCVNVRLKTEGFVTTNGGFVVSRASSHDNYETWYEVMRFTLLEQATLPSVLWTDYTVEQGVGYKYAIQRFNDAGFYTTRIMNKEPVIADFEDTFLFDGERQLKIRFNPKVTSFKNTVLETKTDTLGGQYPFVFRNGNVKYKEFPIGGLISHLSDMDEMFMSNLELGFYEEQAYRASTPHAEELKSIVRGTQVDTNNIAAERKFKLKVLDWLTNGEPKVFRSPGEGNYIVRLMNTSLTPNDTVSRMIHSFTCTAYEMADYTFENLIKYGFVENKTVDNRVLAITSINMNLSEFPHYNLLQDYPFGVYWAEFRHCVPGAIYTLQFLDEAGSIDIRIPVNGFYHVNIYDRPLMTVTLKSLPQGYTKPTGCIDVGYYSTNGVGDFSQIRKISIRDEVYSQIGNTTVNIVSHLTNTKFKIGYVYSVRVETRPKLDIYLLDGRLYHDDLKRNPVDFFPHYLYQVFDKNGEFLYWLDGNDPSQTFAVPNYGLTIQIGEDGTREFIDMNPYGHDGRGGIYSLSALNNLEYLKIGSGLFLEMHYQQKEYIYGVEEDNPAVKEAKLAWTEDPTNTQKFNTFLLHLNAALKEDA